MRSFAKFEIPTESASTGMEATFVKRPLFNTDHHPEMSVWADEDESEPPHIRAFIGFGVSCIAGIAFYLAIWAVLVR